MNLTSNTPDTDYPYSYKCGPILNIFLCYLQPPGHNRKPWTSLVRDVSRFYLLIYMCVSLFADNYKLTPTPTWTVVVRIMLYRVKTPGKTWSHATPSPSLRHALHEIVMLLVQVLCKYLPQGHITWINNGTLKPTGKTRRTWQNFFALLWQ